MSSHKEIEKRKKEINKLWKDIKKGFKTFIVKSNDIGSIEEAIKHLNKSGSEEK